MTLSSIRYILTFLKSLQYVFRAWISWETRNRWVIPFICLISVLESSLHLVGKMWGFSSSRAYRQQQLPISLKHRRSIERESRQNSTEMQVGKGKTVWKFVALHQLQKECRAQSLCILLIFWTLSFTLKKKFWAVCIQTFDREITT